MTPASFPTRPDGAVPREGAVPPSGRLRDALPPGTLVGGSYRIERTLGQGGFGIVYLAADLALQRPVAIKEFLPVHLAFRLEGLQISLREPVHRDAFGRGLQSFLREARLLAQFDHPSLVRVYRFWEENQTAYMAMPYYEGPTLAAARQQMLRPPEEAWLREQLLLPLMGALQTLHDGHCLHRDVAPGNILLLPDGRPILLDFGSARRVVGDMTQPLTAIVNPAYAAIEQYAESPNLPQGPWTDLYGLACVAYFALSGRAPAPATVRAVNETALMPMAEVGLAVERSFPGLRYSPAFLAAIDRALSLRPADRPQSVAELREALISPHVQPDVAFEEPRRSGPPPVEEVRVPRPPEPPEPPEAQATVDGAVAGPAPAVEPEDDEQAAIRATIQTALGEIANWPTIAPRPLPKRGQPTRVEPVLGAEGVSGSRRAAAGKAHLTVVAGADAGRPPQDTETPQAAEAVGEARAAEDAAGARSAAGEAATAQPKGPDAQRPPVETPGEPPATLNGAPVEPAAPLAEARANTASSGDGPRIHEEPLPEETPFTPAERRSSAEPADPFLAGPPSADPGLRNVSAGEPTFEAPGAAMPAEDSRQPDDAWAPTAVGVAAATPAMAEIVPLEVAPGGAEREAEARVAQQTQARGQGWRAAAAVIAAVLLGGGLWYAQDLGLSAWRWMGGGDDGSQTSAAGTAPSRSGTTQVAAATPRTEQADTGASTTAGGEPAATPTPAQVTPSPTRQAAAAAAPQASVPLAAPPSSDQPSAGKGITSSSGTGTLPAAPAATESVAPTVTPAAPTQPEAEATAKPAGDEAANGDLAAARSAASHSAKQPSDTGSASRTVATSTAKAASRKPPPQHVAQAQPGYPPTARAACGARRNFALYYCMKAQCRLERYTHSAECVRLREDDEVE